MSISVDKQAVVVPPEEVGYRAEMLERLERHLRDVSVKHNFQGYSYLFARDGKVFARTSYGNLLHNS
jgi:hypothetical protein